MRSIRHVDYLISRNFNLIDFLNGVNNYELVNLYINMNNFTEEEVKEFLEENDENTIDVSNFLNSKFLNAVTEEMSQYIIETGIDHSLDFKEDIEKSSDIKHLKNDVYLASTLLTIKDIFIKKDFEPVYRDILSNEKNNFDDKYKEFIENYFSHEDIYINYLGGLLILGELLKEDNCFDFLSKRIKTKFISLLIDTLIEFYSENLESCRLVLMSELADSSENIDKLEIELNRKTKAISNLKKKMLNNYKKEEENEKKLLEKELRNKDAIIKKLTNQIPDKKDQKDEKNKKDKKNKHSNIDESLSNEISLLKDKLNIIDNQLSKNSESLLDIKDNISLISNKAIETPKESTQPIKDDNIKAHSENQGEDLEFNMDILEDYLPKERNFSDVNALYKIGYVNIIDDVHYILYPDGDKLELEDIPINIYISDGQFVLTKDKVNFNYSFKYNNNSDYNGFITSIDHFALVVEKDGEYFSDKGNGVLEKIIIRDSSRLRNDQIVGINYENVLSQYYNCDIPSIDIFANSIKAKKQTPYFVIDKTSDSLEVINIFTGEGGILISLDDNRTKREINTHDTIIVKDNTIYGVFPNVKFYTNSSYYHNGQYAPATIRNGDVYIESNSEFILITNIPRNFSITEGQVILVDEFNNLIQATDSRYNTIKFKHTGKKTEKKSKRSENVNLKHKALIVGNLNYEETYKISFAKKGYDVTVLSGYESFTKIIKESKDVDKIFIVSNHVSHDNMNKIKDNLSHKDIAYPKGDGANRLSDLLT